MKRIRMIAAGMFASMLLLAGCSGRAATVQAVENDLETVNSGELVRNFHGGRIAPDATMPLVIDFNADWCGPCRMFKPVFHRAAQKWEGKALFVSVNVDENSEAARQFGVTAIPQVSVYYPDGRVETTAGYMDDTAFDAFLKSTL